MTSRRKFKTERELVADIRKTFAQCFCNKNVCMNCKYKYSNNCEIDYVVELLTKFKDEDED